MRGISITTAIRTYTLPTDISRASTTSMSRVSSGVRWWQNRRRTPLRPLRTNSDGERSMNSSAPTQPGTVMNAMYSLSTIETVHSPTQREWLVSILAMIAAPSFCPILTATAGWKSFSKIAMRPRFEFCGSPWIPSETPSAFGCRERKAIAMRSERLLRLRPEHFVRPSSSKQVQDFFPNIRKSFSLA